MVWMNENQRIWRGIVLGLLLVALGGPWVFDQINVPAQYACSAPFIRLEGDFCGVPLSGFWILGAAGLSVVGLLSGAADLSEAWRPFLFLIGLGLPLMTTAVLLLRGHQHRWIGFQIASFVLVVGLLLLSGLFSDPRQALVLWGASLYLAVAASTLIVEGLGLAARSRGT